jgi:hypothetical protein
MSDNNDEYKSYEDYQNEEKRNAYRIARLCFYAIGIGLFIAGIIFWMSQWYGIVMFHEYSRYPYLYPVSSIMIPISVLGAISLFIIWVVALIKQRKKIREFFLSVFFTFSGIFFGMISLCFLYWFQDFAEDMVKIVLSSLGII